MAATSASFHSYQARGGDAVDWEKQRLQTKEICAQGQGSTIAQGSAQQGRGHHAALQRTGRKLFGNQHDRSQGRCVTPRRQPPHFQEHTDSHKPHVSTQELRTPRQGLLPGPSLRREDTRAFPGYSSPKVVLITKRSGGSTFSSFYYRFTFFSTAPSLRYENKNRHFHSG